MSQSIEPIPADESNILIADLSSAQISVESLTAQLERYAADFSQLLAEYEQLKRRFPKALARTAEPIISEIESILTNQSGFGYISTRVDGTVTKVSLGAAQLLNSISEAMVGKQLDQLIPYECRSAFLRHLVLFTDPNKLGCQIDQTFANGELTSRLLMYGIREPKQDLINWVIRQDQLSQSKGTKRRIEKSFSDPILITDTNWIIQKVNTSYTVLSGYDVTELQGHPAEMLQVEEFGVNLFATIRDTLVHQGEWTGQVWHQHKNGHTFRESLHILGVQDKQGEIGGYVIIFMGCLPANSCRVEQIERLERQDQVTGLPNRRKLIELLGRTIQTAKSNQQLVAVIRIQIDKFSATFADVRRVSWDLIAAHFTQRLRSAVRSSDSLAYLGDLEFALVIEGLGQTTDIRFIREKLRAIANTPITIENTDLTVPIKFGVGLYPRDAENSLELLEKAFPTIRSPIKSATYYSCEADLPQHQSQVENQPQTLSNHEIILYFQPQIDLTRKCLAGIEVFSRWMKQSPESMETDTTNSLGQRSQIMSRLGYLTLETACLQQVNWIQKGIGNFKIAVNVNSAQFFDPDFAERIIEIISSSGIHPNDLELEINESLLIDSSETDIKKLEKLGSKDITIVIDNFGAGYSALGRLQQFSARKLKIGKSVISAMTSEKGKIGLTVFAMIQMAKALEFLTVAEGVENMAQFDVLSEMGCTLAQGPLIANPMSAHHFESWKTSSRWSQNHTY